MIITIDSKGVRIGNDVHPFSEMEKMKVWQTPEGKVNAYVKPMDGRRQEYLDVQGGFKFEDEKGNPLSGYEGFAISWNSGAMSATVYKGSGEEREAVPASFAMQSSPGKKAKQGAKAPEPEPAPEIEEPEDAELPELPAEEPEQAETD